MLQTLEYFQGAWTLCKPRNYALSITITAVYFEVPIYMEFLNCTKFAVKLKKIGCTSRNHSGTYYVFLTDPRTRQKWNQLFWKELLSKLKYYWINCTGLWSTVWRPCYALAELMLSIMFKCKDGFWRRLLAKALDRYPAAQPLVTIPMARHSRTNLQLVHTLSEVNTTVVETRRCKQLTLLFTDNPPPRTAHTAAHCYN